MSMTETEPQVKVEVLHCVIHQRSGRVIAGFYHAVQAQREAHYQGRMGVDVYTEEREMRVHSVKGVAR